MLLYLQAVTESATGYALHAYTSTKLITTDGWVKVENLTYIFFQVCCARLFILYPFYIIIIIIINSQLLAKLFYVRRTASFALLARAPDVKG